MKSSSDSAPSSWFSNVSLKILWLKTTWGGRGWSEAASSWGSLKKLRLGDYTRRKLCFIWVHFRYFSIFIAIALEGSAEHTLRCVYFYENKHQSRNVSTADILRIMNNRKSPMARRNGIRHTKRQINRFL